MFDSRPSAYMSKESTVTQQILALVIPENPFVRELPMDKKTFLDCYHDLMTAYERTEVASLPDPTVIFYAGDIPKRQTGFKLLATPDRVLDDEEGYYKLAIDDHIVYRY